MYEKNLFFYRGKRIIDDEWIEGFHSYKFDRGRKDLIVHGAKHGAAIADVVFPHSVQLCSNYFDSKERRIFEGSVLKTDHPDVPYGFVEFTGGCFAVQSFDRFHGFFLSSFVEKHKTSVVGNLFDVPDCSRFMNRAFPCVTELVATNDLQKYTFEVGCE